MKTEEFNKCLELLRQGDLKGLEKIYNKYYYASKQLALSHVKNEEKATEIVDAFFQNLQPIACEIKEIKNPDIWIFEVIVAICKSNY